MEAKPVRASPHPPFCLEATVKDMDGDEKPRRVPGQAGQSPVRRALSVPVMRTDCGPAVPAGGCISLETVACMVVAV